MAPRTLRQNSGWTNSASSTEGERVGLHPRLQEFDLELSIHRRLGLPDELIEPMLDEHASALRIDVDAMGRPGRPSVEEDAKRHGLASRGRPHDEMKITGVKTIEDAPVRPLQRGGLPFDRPVAGKRPRVESQPVGGSIEALAARPHAAWRREVIRAVVADVRL